MTHRIASIITLMSSSLIGELAVVAPAMATASSSPAGTAPTAAPAATAIVTAVVGKLRNTKGSLQCSLHVKDNGFPGGKPMAIASVTKLSGATATCVFAAVPPGAYAIAVLHDENNNGKLDTNWLGIPSEGYGASNNKLHTFSAPTFAESKFVVGTANVELTINLKY